MVAHRSSLEPQVSQKARIDELHEADRQTLRRLWREGQLDAHIDALERFYQARRDDICQMIEDEADPDQLLQAAKQLVISEGIVDRVKENRDQIAAIESEIWIQGERGNGDRESIALAWSEHYANAWRKWRIKEYLFAAEQIKQQLPQLIRAAAN